MNKFSYIFASTILLLSNYSLSDDDAAPPADSEAGSVLVLTSSNFDETVAAATDGILVEFYAPWCGHCKQLEPEYDAAATLLHEIKSNVKLAKVDATVESDLAQKFGVQGYPTLKWFAGGDLTNPSEYDGGRTRDTIVEWIKKSTGPAVEVIDVASNDKAKFPRSTAIVNELVEAKILSDFPAIILAGGDSIESDEYKLFDSVAKIHRKSGSFIFLQNSAADDKDHLAIVHRGEEPVVFTKSEALESADLLKEKILDNSFPLFGELNGDTFQKYVERPNSPGLVWCLFPMEEGDNVAEVADRYRENVSAVAKNFVGKYSFTYTDTHTFKEALKNMLGVESFPQIVVNKKPQDKQKFVLDLTESKEVKVDELQKFMDDIVAGKIEPVLKSEDIPTYTGEESVRDVVGKNMLTEVFMPETDVLFEVYAPWCGHCKKLAPELEKLGADILQKKANGLIQIKKMDGTANDSVREDIDWSGFPTMFYIKAGSDVVEKYDGPREAEGILGWIKENHSKKDELAKLMDVESEASETATETKEEL